MLRGSLAEEGAVKAIRLKRMGEDEYRTYRDAAVRGYAEDKQRSGDWVSRDALTLSLQAFDRFAPSGLKTPDQHFFTVHDAATDAKVGWLWYQVRDDGLYRSAYLCDPEGNYYEITWAEPNNPITSRRTARA